MCNYNIRRERENGTETTLEVITVRNLTKLVRHQTTYPGNSENTNEDKYQTNKQPDKNNNNKQHKISHIQAAEDQRQRENLERNQRRTTYVQRNKDKKHMGVIKTMQAGEWSGIFKELKKSKKNKNVKNKHQSRVVYRAKLFLKSERELKTFLTKTEGIYFQQT